MKGVALVIVQSFTLESNIANPSWCFVVITMYLIPADFAALTNLAASNFSAVKSGANFRYSFTGIFPRDMIHSPLPATGFP